MSHRLPLALLFQSAPSAQAGRNSIPRRLHRLSGSFNPLPALRLGGTQARCRQAQPVQVSIRSQRSGWEERITDGSKPIETRFQSAPSAQAGRNDIATNSGTLRGVSIRSQR